MRFTTPLLVAIALAAGCQSQLRPEPRSLDDRPLVHPDGQRRSLAFDSPYHRTLAANDPAGEVYAWWDDRADARPSTYAGYEAPDYLYAHTYTVDRMTDHGGKPRPSSSETTYRIRIQRGVR